MEFFATCPQGFEQLLAHELSGLEIPRVRPLQGQVAFGGTLRDAYVACLWSRLASRVVVVLGRGSAATSDALYQTVSDISWEDHLPLDTTLAVSASGTNEQLRTTTFVSLRTKDAIVDRLLAKQGSRPSVNAKSPDVDVAVRISRDRATVGIDLAGAPLFQRGYERSGAQRGLRPDYASALLALAGWGPSSNTLPEAPDSPAPLLVDLTKGSPSIAVEAALVSANHAPGLLRLRWGFAGWATYDEALWNSLVSEAREKAQGEAPLHVVVPSSSKTASSLRSSLRAAGVTAAVDALGEEGIAQLEPPTLMVCDMGSIATDDLVHETGELSRLAAADSRLRPAALAVAARDELTATFVARQPQASLATKLGRDPLYLQAFGASQGFSLPRIEVGSGASVPVLVSASEQFAARLRKVAKQRAKWAKREDITCYRVYDADLPDYAVAIDLYQGCDPATGMPDGRRWLQVAEYAAPKSVDAALARARLMDALAIAPAVLDVEPRNVFLRIRRHGKGGSQYSEEGGKGSLQVQSGGRRDARGRSGNAHAPELPRGAHLIDEGGLTFEVNFSTRLDCGIFLDHRDTRALLREMAKETEGSKRFLNLFAYTGTATCYAADGGMRHTTTVDMSRPSLDWARRNMERNGFAGREHEYVQADVVRWVSEQRHTRNRWDLVFCDVPTFSNSKGMGRRSFDVQRDHAELLIGVSRLLMRGGVCVFSCNLRTFKPNVDVLAKAGVAIEDITARTIPEDFSRNQRIHHAYLVRRMQSLGN